MAERRFAILRYSGKTPSFAMCESCRLKFFTPTELIRDPLRAEANLREKFAAHSCKIENSSARPRGRFSREGKIANGVCDFLSVGFQSEVAGFEEMHFGTWVVAFGGFRSGRQEEGIAVAPDR